MKSVRITVDGVTYTLRQNASGEWTVTNNAPYLAGAYPVTVTATTEAGQNINLGVDDPELTKALLLLVTEGATISGERMLNYYPEVIKIILEFKALMRTEGFEVDFLKNNVELSINESYLSTMTETRIKEWERNLGIAPSSDDSLEDRKESIIARIRGRGKLNSALINSIVGAFTGGTAISYIRDSKLYVKITPPVGNKQYKFNNVLRELNAICPAHLGLEVTRNYATWGEIKDNYIDWNNIKELSSWEELVLYIAPQ